MSDINKKKQHPQSLSDENDAKTLAKKIVLEDLAGTQDWKNSKLGYLSGYPVIKKSVSSVVDNGIQSFRNVQNLWSSLMAGDDTPSLEEGGSPAERFEWSMQLHNKSESDLAHIIANTWKSAILYSILSLVGAILISFSFLYVGYKTYADGLMRFAPLLITIPLIVKHSYTNWMVRNRRLDTIINYLISGDILPKKNGDR
ncbi:hypothetical protein [Mesorhizobium sp. SP-1A]|uniref:hypothetical protein n=1 Tax=Mesorhizobium sp. SP-1A TaxID=3077840 RepID=UPI0028F73899|nr:hypothetical protein [Mesorhizobium sp. SP-1A]